MELAKVRRRAQREAMLDAVYQPASEPLASVRADIQTSEIACSITWFSAGASGEVSAMRSRRIPACGGCSRTSF